MASFFIVFSNGYLLNSTRLISTNQQITTPKAGEERAYSIRYYVAPDTMVKGYKFSAVVDPENTHQDTNVSNNKLQAGGYVMIIPASKEEPVSGCNCASKN